MWGDKKPDAPARTPLPQQPRTNVASGSSSFSGEAKTMAPLDSSYPASSSGSGTARLGASLHVKGEITGNEDLAIDGSVEGLIQLEDRKLTIGASAKVTADVIAREVVVYGNVKGNLRARDRIEIKNGRTSGKSIGQPLRHRSKVAHAAFSPDGRYLLTCGRGNDNEARLWELPPGRLRERGRSEFRCAGHDCAGESLAVNPAIPGNQQTSAAAQDQRSHLRA